MVFGLGVEPLAQARADVLDRVGERLARRLDPLGRSGRPLLLTFVGEVEQTIAPELRGPDGDVASLGRGLRFVLGIGERPLRRPIVGLPSRDSLRPPLAVLGGDLHDLLGRRDRVRLRL